MTKKGKCTRIVYSGFVSCKDQKALVLVITAFQVRWEGRNKAIWLFYYASELCESDFHVLLKCKWQVPPATATWCPGPFSATYCGGNRGFHTFCLSSYHNVWWRKDLGHHVAVPQGHWMIFCKTINKKRANGNIHTRLKIARIPYKSSQVSNYNKSIFPAAFAPQH